MALADANRDHIPLQIADAKRFTTHSQRHRHRRHSLASREMLVHSHHTWPAPRKPWPPGLLLGENMNTSALP